MISLNTSTPWQGKHIRFTDDETNELVDFTCHGNDAIPKSRVTSLVSTPKDSEKRRRKATDNLAERHRQSSHSDSTAEWTELSSRQLESPHRRKRRRHPPPPAEPEGDSSSEGPQEERIVRTEDAMDNGGAMSEGETGSFHDRDNNGSHVGARDEVGSSPVSNDDRATTAEDSYSPADGSVARAKRRYKQRKGVVSRATTSRGPVPYLHTMLRSLTEEEKQNCFKEGIEIRTGPFSEAEDRRLVKNWHKLRDSNDWSDDAIVPLLGIGAKNAVSEGRLSHRKRKYWRQEAMDANLYQELARRLDNRPLLSIYQRCRKIFDPSYHMAFTAEMDDALLELHAQYPNNWLKIAQLMNHNQYKVRERYLQMKSAEEHAHGPFTYEESIACIEAVAKVSECSEDEAVATLKVSDIDWPKVATEMNLTRPVYILSQHWAFVIRRNNHLERRGHGNRFSPRDSRHLVRMIRDAKVPSEIQIDWPELAERFPLCSEMVIRRAWSRLKKNMTEQKVSAIWKIKKFAAKFSPSFPVLHTDLPFQFHGDDQDDDEFLRGLQWSARLYGEDMCGKGRVMLEIDATIRFRPNDGYYDRGRSVWASVAVSLLDQQSNALTSSQNRFVEYSPYLSAKGYFHALEFKREDLNAAVQSDGSLRIRIDVTIFNVRESLRCREVLRGLLANKTQADFDVKVGEHSFKLHKAVLAGTSTVFAAMFDSGLQEAVNAEGGVFTLSGTTPAAFKAFTEALYGTYGDLLSDVDLTQDVLHLAETYNICSLKHYCDRGLAEKVDESNALEILTGCAAPSNAERTKEKCIGILAELTEFKESPLWLDFKTHNRRLALEILDRVSDKLITSVKHLKREASNLHANNASLAQELDAAKSELKRKCDEETVKASCSKRRRK